MTDDDIQERNARLECLKLSAQCATDRFKPESVVGHAKVLYDYVVGTGAGAAADSPLLRNTAPVPATEQQHRKRKDKA